MAKRTTTMAKRTTARRGKAKTARAQPSPRTLLRRLGQLNAQQEAERARHQRQLASLRRATERRLAEMVQDIAALRHHEARAEALARLLAEREAELAAQSERLARLEALLQRPTELG
jgi:hypothetical protein